LKSAKKPISSQRKGAMQRKLHRPFSYQEAVDLRMIADFDKSEKRALQQYLKVYIYN
jgi:hypothetical protein